MASVNESEVRALPACVDLVSLHQAHPARYPFLLESLATGGATSRYDILFAFPGDELIAGVPSGVDFLTSLDAWWSRERLPQSSLPLPFVGGWFVYLGYELATQVEPCLALPRTVPGQPTAYAVRIPAAIINDRLANRAWLVTEHAAARLLDELQRDAAALTSATEASQHTRRLSRDVREDSPNEFLQGVERIKEYIVAGDVFQVNLSRGWCGELAPGCGPADVYRQLRRSNPAPFCGSAVYAGWSIASSSPERLVRVHQGNVETRPIAGTRPRGRDNDDDARQWQALLAHPKERAEHIMLIDLERNDLGRICVAGSVAVSELMVLESYQHVHHIVSNVRGRLRSEVTPGAVMRAVFPGGTITGCPKVRCMQIIAELEQQARGPYTGSFGYLNCDGSMDLNILIRTIWMHERRWFLRAGAGIVADSQPDAELAETRAKARGMLAALGEDL
jgi:anthranilate synthase component 1